MKDVTVSTVTESNANGPNAIGPLVDALIRLSDRGGMTPVLVIPRPIGLRPKFFEAVTAEVIRRTGRPVRIDWYRPSVGVIERFAEPLARRFTRRLNRSLATIGDARIEITASIGRPAGPRRELVIGYCRDESDLPPWGWPVRLFVTDPDPAYRDRKNQDLATGKSNLRDVPTRSAA